MAWFGRSASWTLVLAGLATAVATYAGLAPSEAAEPATCLSSDPSVWPKSSKPYFMMAMDTSGSMYLNVGSPAIASSCGYGTTRIAHARCAFRNTVLAYSGQVNFGLSTFAMLQLNCTGANCGGCGAGFCYNNCQYFCFTAEVNTTGFCVGCGPRPGGPETRAGAMIQVPVLQDSFWTDPPPPSNVNDLLAWADNSCTADDELFANGNTPLNGILRDMKRYFQTGWTDPAGGAFASYPSPLATQDLAGDGVNGSTGCRSVNVILVTDGDETCDTQQDAVNAALDLYQNGVTVGGKTYKIRVHVINFVGGTKANTDAIAAAGGTTTSYLANNETELAQALSNIISSSVNPETCDNKDNNCNGCTDEGFKHYCNVQPVAADCCSLPRATCLAQYQASITPGNPTGNLALLPCTTAVQQTEPLNWLCYDPKEKCDSVDNNCQGGVDEGTLKCGSPAHCPLTETCNGLDDDCDGVTDEGVCAGCVPSAEICDGCDNDCDGVADDGVAAIPCGLSTPPNCQGTMSCKPAQPVATPGGCVAGGGYNTCSNSPQAETCDNLDNDCDGIIDDNVAPTACVPAGTPPGLIYGGTSQCKMGQQTCGSSVCLGFVGPSTEVCDGIDNDCDGLVDEQAFGVGQPCGVSTGECSTGITACVGGALICQGGVGPTPEQCDGLDNDCDGATDEAPLADAPPPASNGCWDLPGNCCSWDTLSWCPPTGATCTGNGSLLAPCNKGTVACVGGTWVCQNPKGPSPEICDGVDNNCDGQVNEGLSGTPCGTDTGECVAGVLQCINGVSSCLGSVGPTTEVCDNLDNDCDGQTDEGVPGIGAACGNATPPCAPGVTACVAGQIICQGAVLPQNEVCDGVDNDCDGAIDETPLADGPPPGQTACWGLPGNCCSFANYDWCPPTGGTCNGIGTLVSPCAPGALSCAGAAGWTCVGGALPGAEVCDGADNNCDGQSDNVAPTPCVPVGTPPGLVYGGTSQCKQGTKTCGACVGFVGPSAEICDGIDNDCDGTVDDQAFGVGQACGVNQPPCTPGTTACVNGAIVCQGGNPPQPEVCDGIDNDCDGTADDAPLADAPLPGQNGCWQEPGNCCSFANLTWCPPPGANCNDNGTLSSPCNKGAIACAGAAGWTCSGAKGPAPETCDGLDNDCNAAVDDGTLPGVGGVCGSDVGECQLGTLDCTSGILDCVGDVPPTQEVCDGLDNDCDGAIDNGIPTGGPCTPPYDQTLYPGDRSYAPCQPGVYECDGAGGLVCSGGIGPSPELCDGLDNDCDGTVDEVGPAPDGIDGSANPFPPPSASVGEACGSDMGECKQGIYVCENGNFVCLGGQGAAGEECDCKDNDCNGVVDNNPICGASAKCVATSNGCQCAEPCDSGEFPCPSGQKCETVTESGTGENLGSYCVVDYEALCGDCATKTKTDANGTVICAPAGTELAGCIHPPVCVCKGPAGCDDPCTGVVCDPGLTCAPSGPKAGTCVLDNCYNVPCQGCDKACNLGACVDNPCKEGSCPPDEVCKPDDTFTGFTCVGSCAGVSCDTNEFCKEGVCVPGCDPSCENGEVCDTAASPPQCVQNQCDPNPCTDGACCDPVTGACGNCPCEGVVCPDGQTCVADECILGAGGSGGSGGGSSTTTGSGGSSGTGTGTHNGGGGAGGKTDRGTWGLATGGGGCACSLADSQSPRDRGAWAGAVLFAAAAFSAAVRRKKRPSMRGASEEVKP